MYMFENNLHWLYDVQVISTVI